MRQVSEAVPRAATKHWIDLIDRVTFGIQRIAEADRLNSRFIFVSEIYEGADRMSSRIGVDRRAAAAALGLVLVQVAGFSAPFEVQR
ncbi:hypothetical protein [Bradyrhizobium sp. BR 10261]|uniref:hypothetical protein n=1 Tax=Bradyrhizobium sp. BR 10261 TaxID=2749992 RepID=UPI001C6489D4|nr:hypothetical protein [Bradyrhizobium sp. BR 10261]MBW7965290.1 hypothetical protein [Bradyrhizobium sp. BR 10261]